MFIVATSPNNGTHIRKQPRSLLLVRLAEDLEAASILTPCKAGGLFLLHFLPPLLPLVDPKAASIFTHCKAGGLILPLVDPEAASIFTPCKAEGPFLPLVDPEATSLPLVRVGLSIS
ncbi:hypothetical protein Tco_1226837 [Tanacetum coccineum]